jgi:hypothetical protein
MDDYRLIGIAFMAVASVFFWLVALAVPLALIRRFFPSMEWWFYSPVSVVIANLARLARQGFRAILKRG